MAASAPAPLSRIKHIVVVLSGKGGVGKSSVATQLALSLSLAGRSVSLLDIDLTGPSIPRMLSIEDAKVTQAPGGWLPVPVHAADPAKNLGRLSAMSLGFLLQSRGDAVVWRGPKKTAMVRQFLSDVLWEADTDFLVIDTPPGTGDEQISLVETLHRLCADDPARLAGAVVVTTPQQVAVADVRKELNFCAKTGLAVLGVVENMSGYNCERCPGCWDPFNAELDADGNVKQKDSSREGGGRAMAREFGVAFLGEVPLDPQFIMLVEAGRTPVRREWRGEGEEAGGGGEWVDVVVEGPEPATLAEKYARCSLADRFAGMRDELLGEIEKGGA
jgi:Mrp family chromosome partitioning ATPase